MCSDADYKCDVLSTLILSQSEVTNVSTEHHDISNSDDEFNFFLSDGNFFESFPRNLGKFFKNLSSISIHNSKIYFIEKEDLESIGDKLINLDLVGNGIQVLDYDLFHHNPNIQKISFKNQPLKYVGRGAFENLKKLNELILSKNTCYNGQISGIISSDFVTNVENRCSEVPVSYVKRYPLKILNEFTKIIIINEKLLSENNFVKMQLSGFEYKETTQLKKDDSIKSMHQRDSDIRTVFANIIKNLYSEMETVIRSEGDEKYKLINETAINLNRQLDKILNSLNNS